MACSDGTADARGAPRRRSGRERSRRSSSPFPDWYGRLMGKRLTGRFFAETRRRARLARLRLPARLRHGDGPGARLRVHELGERLRRHPLPARLGDALRRAAWLPKTALVLCDAVDGGAARRSRSRRGGSSSARSSARRRWASSPKGGAELELYLFRETYDSARQKHWHDLVPFGGYIEDYHILQGTREEPVVGELVRALEKSGVPMEGSKGEWGPGQQEMNVEYCELLEQADRNVLDKHAAKEIAHAEGARRHVHGEVGRAVRRQRAPPAHLALGRGGKERTSSPGERSGVRRRSRCRDTFRLFLGGLVAHAAELTAFWAPSVNSYKRFQSASFAPTTIAWSVDNRTAGFRVVGEGESLRIECRIPGADANPYVAWAATLAAGLDGIDAPHRAAGRPSAGDVYAAKALPRVPGSLRDAIALLESSALAKEAFGEDVVEHYLHFLRTEQRKFDEVVTSWERGRFFERG